MPKTPSTSSSTVAWGRSRDGVTSLLAGAESLRLRPRTSRPSSSTQRCSRCSCCRPAESSSRSLALRRGPVGRGRIGPWWRVGARSSLEPRLGAVRPRARAEAAGVAALGARHRLPRPRLLAARQRVGRRWRGRSSRLAWTYAALRGGASCPGRSHIDVVRRLRCLHRQEALISPPHLLHYRLSAARFRS